jgi:hypothetical protein
MLRTRFFRPRNLPAANVASNDDGQRADHFSGAPGRVNGTSHADARSADRVLLAANDSRNLTVIRKAPKGFLGEHQFSIDDNFEHAV